MIKLDLIAVAEPEHDEKYHSHELCISMACLLLGLQVLVCRAAALCTKEHTDLYESR